MSNKPTHIAYVVTDPKEGSNKKAIWHRVGSVFQHKNGKGFDLVIPDGVSLSGRIVCTEPMEQAKSEQAKTTGSDNLLLPLKALYEEVVRMGGFDDDLSEIILHHAEAAIRRAEATDAEPVA